MNPLSTSTSSSAKALRRLAIGLTFATGLSACGTQPSTETEAALFSSAQHNAALLASDERVLKLEGSSNFRDMGGYQTDNGQRIRLGQLYRSGTMSGLTETDQAFLNQQNFSAVVDLRSNEELELYPNHWAQSNEDIRYLNHAYSMMAMMGRALEEDAQALASQNPSQMMTNLYRHLPEQLVPQLRLYFAELLDADGAVIVNCSAGQDRTGFASAMLLSALGVPRQTILDDYLLSTQYRRPAVETGGVDLKAAAETNAFAKMMLRYSSKADRQEPNPLYTADGTPFLHYAFAEIESRYGSVEAYLEKAIGVDASARAVLRKRYLD